MSVGGPSKALKRRQAGLRGSPPEPLVPASGRYALHLQPGVVHRWGHGGADGAGVDVPDDVEGLLQGVVHAQHFVAALGLLCRLLHQRVLVPTRVQVCQQLGMDEVLGL